MALRLRALAAAMSLALPLMIAGAGTSAAPRTPATLPRSGRLTPDRDIVATLKSWGRFTILLRALAATGLGDAVKSAPHLTLFAPTDAAFSDLPPARFAAMMAPANATLLEKILAYHLLDLDLDFAEIKALGRPMVSIEAAPLRFKDAAFRARVNDADIIAPDVRANNGVIHVIDKVLIPPDLVWPSVLTPAPRFGGAPR